MELPLPKPRLDVSGAGDTAAGAIGMRRFAGRVRDVQEQHELEPPG